jgi:hypothetical protein
MDSVSDAAALLLLATVLPFGLRTNVLEVPLFRGRAEELLPELPEVLPKEGFALPPESACMTLLKLRRTPLVVDDDDVLLEKLVFDVTGSSQLIILVEVLGPASREVL